MDRILLIGEVLYDSYEGTKYLGGAPFNVAYHLAAMGERVFFMSRIGVDADGSRIMKRIEALRMDPRLIQKDPLHKTGIVRVTIGRNGTPDFIIEENAAYDFIEPEKTIDRIVGNSPDLVYFGTLAQRNAQSRATIRNLISAYGPCSRIMCDVNLRQEFYTKEILEESLRASDIVKLNREELYIISDIFSISGDDVSRARSLSNYFEIESLCLTLGEKGAVLLTNDGLFVSDSEPGSSPIVDTVGAGDAFSALFAYGSVHGWHPGEIVSKATAFASEICTTRGALPEDARIYDPYI